jgi:hypothetical protein
MNDELERIWKEVMETIVVKGAMYLKGTKKITGNLSG